MAVYQKAVVVTEVTLNAMSCPVCGVVQGIPEELEEQRRKDHGTVYCPNGHTWSWGGKTQAEKEVDRLRAALDQEKAATRNLGRMNDQLSNDIMDKAKELKTTRAKLTRTEKRVHAGVCPECNRHFVNVERHMHTKHPKPACK